MLDMTQLKLCENWRVFIDNVSQADKAGIQETGYWIYWTKKKLYVHWANKDFYSTLS